MDVSSEAALSELALLKPRQSLQNMGEKKDDDKRQDQGFRAFGPDGFTFLDFLDIVNPLQHIPIISSLYREMTGDSIDPGSRIAGGTLFGGPIGAAVATANVALNANTGKDMGDHIMAFLNGEDGEPDGGTAPVELANGPIEAKGGRQQMAGLAPLSPIAANMEVLEWARRESALMAGTQAPATAQTPTRKPIEEARSQTVENKVLPGGFKDPYEIAANSEVLDWARAEAQLARQPENDEQAQAQARDQQREMAIDTARQKKLAAGLTHQQLSGAAAPSGGWFSETMLLALASYQESAGLGKSEARAINASKEIGELDLRPDD